MVDYFHPKLKIPSNHFDIFSYLKMKIKYNSTSPFIKPPIFLAFSVAYQEMFWWEHSEPSAGSLEPITYLCTMMIRGLELRKYASCMHHSNLRPVLSLLCDVTKKCCLCCLSCLRWCLFSCMHHSNLSRLYTLHHIIQNRCSPDHGYNGYQGA